MYAGKGKKTAAFLALSVLMTGCAMLPQEEEFPDIRVEASSSQTQEDSVQVLRGTLRRETKVQAQYLPSSEEELYFSVEGEEIAQFYVSKGDTVHKGDLIAELDMGSISRELEEETYTLSQLQLEKKHQQENMALLEQQGKKDTESWISASNRLLELEETLQVQEKKLQELKEEQEKRQVRAGMDGTIQRIQNIEETPLSSSGSPVAVIQDYESSLFISETQYTDYFSLGQTLVLTLTDDREVPVKVSQIVEGEQVFFALQEPDPSLKKGFSASVMLVLEEKTDTLYVPLEYLKTSGDQNYLFVKDENGLRTLCPVQVGMVTDDYAEILEGVQEGDVLLQ